MFLWTISLGLYLYLSFTKSRNTIEYYVKVFATISWSVPIIIISAALVADAIGWDSDKKATPGWCWIKDNPDFGSQWIWWVISGKGIEILSCFIIPTIFFYTRKFPSQALATDTRAILSNEVKEVIEEADRKMILIPIIFIFMRCFGCIRFVLQTIQLAFPEAIVSPNNYALVLLQGIGDSSQGWANGLLFILGTRQIRNHILGNIRRLFGSPDNELQSISTYGTL
eukprot:TRINITY_DN976_c0_g1_i1.p1 TRINITY_DN976_c0_g1~~TRINITY_DN976_c0_g1_i1.p1  ORF type:complete len:226 (+),score=34.40 TRINITY_DN976_c0_g1_i1:778-1455(+)